MVLDSSTATSQRTGELPVSKPARRERERFDPLHGEIGSDGWINPSWWQQAGQYDKPPLSWTGEEGGFDVPHQTKMAVRRCSNIRKVQKPTPLVIQGEGPFDVFVSDPPPGQLDPFIVGMTKDEERPAGSTLIFSTLYKINHGDWQGSVNYKCHVTY